MRAIALFGPKAGPRDLDPFRLPGVEIVEQWENAGAALVFGGDGTVHRYLPQLAGSGIALLPVPRGSGNDFARNIGIPTAAAALAAWRAFVGGAGSTRLLDLGLVTPLANPAEQHYFCNVAGVGLDSDANRRANAYPSWLRGGGGYVLAALSSILRFQPLRITLSGGVNMDEEAWFVAFANCHSYGDRMMIAPAADPADGRLDICFIRRTSRLFLLRLFPTVFRGTHVHRPEVVVQQTAESILVQTETPLPIYGDGEYLCLTPAEARTARYSLRIVNAGTG